MNIKEIIIRGKPKELEFIARVLNGVIMITHLSSYHNTKKEGKLILETNRK